MSARANSARNAFHRSLNPYLRPHPSGPINKNQQPKRKTGINTTLDRFHKLIVDLNRQNAKLIEIIDNMEKIKEQNSSPEEEDIFDQKTKEEEKKAFLNEFQTSISNHRKSLEKRLKRLNEIEENLSIFRFDEPQPQPPKVEFPPVNPNIPTPRAHLRTSPRFDLANSITKAENDQLTAKTLYLERMIIVQTMKLKLCHDHRELAQLSKELSQFQSSIQNESTSPPSMEPIPPSNSRKSLKSPRMLKNSSSTPHNIEIEEEEKEEELNSVSNINKVNKSIIDDNNKNDEGNENNSEENSVNDIENNIYDDDDGESYEEIEDQKLKNSIAVLKAAIEYEKQRIKGYKSKYYLFREAAIDIQRVWRGYNFRFNSKK